MGNSVSGHSPSSEMRMRRPALELSSREAAGSPAPVPRAAQGRGITPSEALACSAGCVLVGHGNLSPESLWKMRIRKQLCKELTFA